MKKKIFDLIISYDSTVKQAMQKIEKNALGIVFILDDDKKLVGSLSDGDIRRYILNDGKIDDVVNQAMNKSFTSATDDLSTGEILRLMDIGLKLIPVIDEKGRIINIHDRFSMAMVPRIAKTYHGRAPARITFCGGGSDTTAFSKRSPGAVLNASVNVFAHSILKLRKDKKIKIFSSDLNSEIIADNLSSLVDKKKDSEFALIIALMELLQPNFGFDLTLWSDFPKKSGLGGSASVLCSVTACMDQVLGYNLTNNEIAELTFQAERLNLGVPGGWQDQYSSAIGGINLMEFDSKKTLVSPIPLSSQTIRILEHSLVLCGTGLEHESGNIHDDQKQNLTEEKIFENVKKNVQMVFTLRNHLEHARISELGEVMDAAWELKKTYSPLISNSFLDEIYSFSKEHGAKGGKILGAGGGGFFLFYVEPEMRTNLTDALIGKGLQIQPFQFDFEGAQGWSSFTEGK